MSVNLQRGQRISLAKPIGVSLAKVRMRLDWDADTVTKRGLFGDPKSVQQSIVLDATAVLCDSRSVVDQVWWRQLKSKDRSVVHTGDNQTGAGDGADESILVGSGNDNAQLMAQVAREANGWVMAGIGAIASGRISKELLPAITKHI